MVRSAKDRAWDTMRDKVRYVSLLCAAQAFRRAMSYSRNLSSIPRPCHTFSVGVIYTDTFCGWGR